MYYFTYRKGKKCTISLCFYLLGAGTGAEYFLRLRLLFFFGASPAPVFFKRLRLHKAKNMRLLAARAPQPSYHMCSIYSLLFENKSK